ncbi:MULTISPECIES: hypothetical protein [unclassified Chitinophaga]|uniref:hypothetical protein n=1 Tax=unclassified Chitinophaga TaxID=2619133 RepID=UPI00300F9C5B
MKRNFLSIKKILLLVAMAALWLSQAVAAPTDTVLRLFSQAFPDAKCTRWVEDNEYYIVSFTRDETQCRIWYDKAGTLVYALRYCGESELPLSVLLTVKKEYADKHIAGVTELTNKNGVSYELLLSDNKKWYVVKSSSDGDMYLKYAMKKQ